MACRSRNMWRPSPSPSSSRPAWCRATTRSRTPRRSSTTCSANSPSPISAATTLPMSTRPTSRNTALGKGIQEGKTQPDLHRLDPRLQADPGRAGQRASQASEPKGLPATAAPASGSVQCTVPPLPAECPRSASSNGAEAVDRDLRNRRLQARLRGARRRTRRRDRRRKAVDRRSSQVTALFSDKAAAEAARAKSDAKKLEAERRARSIMQGYTGNMCSECQNFTMVRNGTCEKCDTCGATSGCS